MQAHPGGCRDETVPEAEGPDRLRWVVVRKYPCAWDASDGARRGEAADAARPLPHLAAGDAGKLAGQGRDVQERDASCLPAHRFAPSASRGAAAELCTRGAALSAEQSCVAQAAAAGLQLPEALPDAAQRVQPGAQKRQQPKALREWMA